MGFKRHRKAAGKPHSVPSEALGLVGLLNLKNPVFGLLFCLFSAIVLCSTCWSTWKIVISFGFPIKSKNELSLLRYLLVSGGLKEGGREGRGLSHHEKALFILLLSEFNHTKKKKKSLKLAVLLNELQY